MKVGGLCNNNKNVGCKYLKGKGHVRKDIKVQFRLSFLTNGMNFMKVLSHSFLLTLTLNPLSPGPFFG